MGAVFTLIGVVSPDRHNEGFATVWETAAIGNTALRMYFIAFIFALGINIISSYYMQPS